MSTNDVTALSGENKFCVTILTTEKAKIIDIITVLHVGAKLLVITSLDNQIRVKEWLEKFIIMDDAQISDVTSMYTVDMIYGNDAIKKILISVDLSTLELDNSCFYDVQENYIVYKENMWSVPVYSIVCSEERSSGFKRRAGQVNSNLIEILRVEQGVPLYKKELTEEINPLEAGLEKYISFTKGCYIGQEVIARLDTYKKLRKRITGLVFKEWNENLLRSGKLYHSNVEVGFTTSHVWSPKLQKYIALGYINTDVEAECVEFKNDAVTEFASARISSVPFVVPSFY